MSKFTGLNPNVVFGPAGFEGPKTAVFFDDFMEGGVGTSVAYKFASTANAAQWLFTEHNAGTRVIGDALNAGVLVSTLAASASSFTSYQLNGEAFVVAQDRIFRGATRVKFTAVTAQSWFWGLASTDVTGSTVGPILDGTNDSIGFRNVAGTSGVCVSVVEDDTNETTGTGGTTVADTWHTLAFEFKGGTNGYCKFYFDGALVATITTNLPDAGAALTPTFEHAGNAQVMNIDWLYYSTER